MKNKPLSSRKDLAQRLGPDFTARQVAENESKWGLNKARVSLPTRRVFYRTGQAMRILQAQGFEEEE